MNATEKMTHYENIVRQEWTNNTTITAWDRWSKEQAIHCQPLSDALMKHAQLEPGLKVLDLAAGVGQPALSIAESVTPGGQLIATDLSQGMLDVAADSARTLGIQNIDFELADAHDLPYADSSFDRVVSRLGLMYFWNIDQAIREIYRVLKPGGIASFVVWGADEKNEYFGNMLTPFVQRKDMPAMPEDAPTPSRFADCAALAARFQSQSFAKVAVHEYCEPLLWPGNPRSLFHHFYDMAVPLQPYIDSFSEADQEAAIKDIEGALAARFDGEHTAASASFNVVCLEK